jgi:hypothetical protein
MAALTHYPNAASKAVQGMLHVEQEEKKERSPTPTLVTVFTARSSARLSVLAAKTVVTAQ